MVAVCPVPVSLVLTAFFEWPAGRVPYNGDPIQWIHWPSWRHTHFQVADVWCFFIHWQSVLSGVLTSSLGLQLGRSWDLQVFSSFLFLGRDSDHVDDGGASSFIFPYSNIKSRGAAVRIIVVCSYRNSWA